MEIDNPEDKLVIIPERVIHILLKKLMYIQNELTYVKNKAYLNSEDYDASGKVMGAKQEDYDTEKIVMGASEADNDAQELIMGASAGDNDAQELIMGASAGDNDAQELIMGASDVDNAPPKKSVPANDDASHSQKERNPVSSMAQTLAKLGGSASDSDKLHTFFEQGLGEALQQYVKNGDRQHSLYNYYSNFVEAVAEKNSSADRQKIDASNLPLEETHVLPKEIPYNNHSRAMVRLYLFQTLPRKTKKPNYLTVVQEIMFLHNNESATRAQLKDLTGLSVTGLSKHLLKLISYGIIKTNANKEYVLGDKSMHILLKIYGVPKVPPAL
jgi:hypothetical protein